MAAAVRACIRFSSVTQVRGSIHLIDFLFVKQLSLPHETFVYKVVILDAGEGAARGVEKVWLSNTAESTRL